MPLPARGRNYRLVAFGAHLLHLGAAARIALLDARPQQLALIVEQHHGRQHARHADADELTRFGAGRRPAARA